ncbi:MAG: hypothetical protein K0M45_09160 [Candidatus Paracaedibacteraceae bacterium]|nr:hypothetical protein [Candidatus Paracaedibacteraceae bacterium]
MTGYPGDKGIADPHDPLHTHSWGRTMWTAGGTITGMHAEDLEFEIDINHGNSGGPIWGEWQGYYHIFGITNLDHHGPNPIHWHYHSGVRITNFKLNLINGMINGPW